MRKIMIAMLLLTGCGNRYPAWDHDGPYPIGTCFDFTATKTATRSYGRDATQNGGEYYFVIKMPAGQLKPVECKS